VWDAALILRGADFFTMSSAVVAAEEGKPVGVSLVAAFEKGSQKTAPTPAREAA
jgi:hypothetical protein